MSIYLPEVSSVCLLLLTSVKNMEKFVFLIPVYISVFQNKNKKQKKSQEKKDLRTFISRMLKKYNF